MTRKSSLLELKKEYEKVLMEQNIGIESSPQNVLLKNALKPSGEQMADMVNKADAEKEKCQKCEDGNCADHKTISFVAPKVEEEEECASCDPNMEAHDDSNLNMAKSEIFKIQKYASQLSNITRQSCKIEAWMLAKLVQASDYLCSVTGVLEYDTYEKQVEQPAQDFSNDMHLISKITGMLNGESKEVNEAVLKRVIFNLELINNK